MKKSKYQIVLTVILWTISILAVLFMLFGKEIFGQNEFVNSILLGDLGTFVGIVGWLTNNANQVFLSLLVIVIFMAFYQVLKFLLKNAFMKTNDQKTSTRLIISFLKYLTAFVVFLVILSIWGVDGTALIASAGVIGLVIAFGAQSIIADILAGFFIVFEKEFKVGDIIMIGDFRGTVEMIGVRTTRIKDPGGNIKIINNSEIKQVINMTTDYSNAVVDIDIEYSANLQDVEKVIAARLPELATEIKEIKVGPTYLGVSNLHPNGVTLKFLAKSLESDRAGVERALRRSLKLIFDEHNITIPVTQVVLKQNDINKKINVPKDIKKK